jgi:hypothetical protein
MTDAPVNPTAPLKQAKMKPCCLAISADAAAGMDVQSSSFVPPKTRTWRALSLDDQTELAKGEVAAGSDELLMIIREKAATAARGIGYDPQQFILETK